ncbi:enoyl-CoA hydratase/isomerase family protein [Paenimyroides tangerinum]|uniref:Enoyl-CoA hydratase/isomerase family protein n=1 Tax=Paenimyroides tangerinum TaxID=2488728 RepID=A0A3P3WEC7_9FLAO|nr:enoyl-CoA hydratase/isomerase family protein [Paenimyroides tangerinum]RRJ92426.1 enoyl-CoA hydratase/isomerase family protein [Paenimyroides tangerinum]
MQTTGTINTTITEKIATINFYHPASNSFPSEQLQALTNAINELNSNKEVTLIILASEGEKAFCAGASFDELLQINDLENGTKFFSGFANVINAMRTSNKLIIGRVQGKTVGGGVGLAAACDYCFATENASIKLSELAIGIGPFVIEPAVTRKIGFPAMSEMTLEAETWKSAQWAKEKQLFTQVFSSIQEMDEAIEKFANRLSNYNPEALSEMKKVLWKNTEHWDVLLKERAGISGKLVLSDFTVNALNAFKNK